MSTEQNSSHGLKSIDERSAEARPFRDAPAAALELVEQRERLEAMKRCEREIEVLERRRCELEVERIEMEARAKRAEPRPGLDTSRVADIADALHKKRKLETALHGHAPEGARGSTAAKEIEQLKLGLDALLAWIDAPDVARPTPLLKVVYAAVMIATLVVIWSAIFVHPVLLLILLGLGVVLTFLRSFNQNVAWVRLGAKRQFAATELKPPPRWEEAAVRERIAEFKTRIETLSQQEIEPEPTLEELQDEQVELERREVEFAMAEMHLTKLSSDAGLDIDSMDAETEKWLEDLATSRHARRELEQVSAKLRSINTERGRLQDMLYRFLTRQGEAPEDGSADCANLSAGLDRVAARLSK